MRNSLGGSFFYRVKPSHKPRTTPKLNRVIFNLLLGPHYGIIVTIGRERSRANEATIVFNSVEAILDSVILTSPPNSCRTATLYSWPARSRRTTTAPLQ